MERTFNRYTLITGASQGIGKALARECAGRKMNLFLVSLPGTGLPALAESLSEENGVRVEILETDLMQPESLQIIASSLINNGISVDTLINNVGVGYNGHFPKLESDKIIRMIMLNMQTTTLLTLLLLPDMISLPRARIMNMCSIASWLPLPGKSIYSATKAYVLYFSEALRQELKHTGITVTSVSPLGVPTNDQVRERIKSSGIVARKAVMETGEIARIAVEGMVKGEKTIIPGKMNKLVFTVANLLPFGLVMQMARKEIMRVPSPPLGSGTAAQQPVIESMNP